MLSEMKERLQEAAAALLMIGLVVVVACVALAARGWPW